MFTSVMPPGGLAGLHRKPPSRSATPCFFAGCSSCRCAFPDQIPLELGVLRKPQYADNAERAIYAKPQRRSDNVVLLASESGTPHYPGSKSEVINASGALNCPRTQGRVALPLRLPPTSPTDPPAGRFRWCVISAVTKPEPGPLCGCPE